MKQTYSRFNVTPQTAPPSTPSKRTLPYMKYLNTISARTGTPISSLLVSFGILHEATAVAPLFGFFFLSRSLGIGERTVQMAFDGEGGEMIARWTREGEAWAARVGSRYGIWGFQKRAKGEPAPKVMPSDAGMKIVGDVANAIVAYGLTKAILPLRIGLSLYLSPAFSRGAVEPTRKQIARMFTRRKSTQS